MEQVGRYKIIEEIGKGGMAVVFRAQDGRLHREVALKLLAAHLEKRENIMTRFTQEAQIIARLEHPHIVPIYDYGVHEGRPYLVMRLLKGGTLQQHMAEQPWDPVAFWLYAQQIANALDDAHAHNIIHRDIKPSNILFDERNMAYVSDFGVAKILNATTRITKQHRVLGTPAYMSPEQCNENEVSKQSDQYSLGVLIFEALAGQLPFTGDTLQVMYQHAHDPPPALHKLNESIPLAMTPILAKALAKKPEDRFPTAMAFISSLQKAYEGSSQKGSAKRPAKAVSSKQETHVEARHPAYERGLAAFQRGSWRIAISAFSRVPASDPYYEDAVSKREEAERHLKKARPRPRPKPLDESLSEAEKEQATAEGVVEKGFWTPQRTGMAIVLFVLVVYVVARLTAG